MKTFTRTLSLALAGMSLTVLSACNTANNPDSQARATSPAVASIPSPPKCYECGTIVNIEQSKEKGNSSGIGAVVGAVAGAVIGHQIGDGRGQDAATATGAIGGGIAGNEIEKRVKGTTYFHVTVAMENGGTQTTDVDALNGLATGSKVKVIGNNLQFAGT